MTSVTLARFSTNKSCWSALFVFSFSIIYASLASRLFSFLYTIFFNSLFFSVCVVCMCSLTDALLHEEKKSCVSNGGECCLFNNNLYAFRAIEAVTWISFDFILFSYCFTYSNVKNKIKERKKSTNGWGKKHKRM